MEKNMKPWWESKTIWLNLILFAIAVIGLLVDSNAFDQYDEVLLLCAAMLNLVLRYFFTDTAIK
jgi:NADH:ubiquinone oxidoreductase subunit K